MSAISKILFLILHWSSHLDEIVGAWLLKKFGEQKYPGVSDAKIDFLGLGGRTPDGRSAQEWEAEGALFVGTGRGKFDEHPSPDRERRARECAASLVMKDLGLEKNPGVSFIVYGALREDLRFGMDKEEQRTEFGVFHLASMIKSLHRSNPTEPQKVIDFVFATLDAIYNDQIDYQKALVELKGKDVTWETIVRKDDVLKVAIGSSDNKQFSMAARSLGANVVVQFNCDNHFQIFTSRKDIDLRDVVRLLRIASLEKAGINPFAKGVTGPLFKYLEQSGTVEKVEEIFYFEEGQMILNGSDSAPHIDPTNLSKQQIVKAVMTGLDPVKFCPDHAESCLQGVCPAMDPKVRCPWFPLGLMRCRDIRQQMMKAAAKQSASRNGHVAPRERSSEARPERVQADRGSPSDAPQRRLHRYFHDSAKKR